MPANDVSSLTSILPKRNYESAEPHLAGSGKAGAGGTLLKTNSANMEESHQLTATSRKL